MKDISLEELLHFSQKIEKESYSFYKNATLHLKDTDLITISEELALAELDHLNKIRNLLNEERMSRAELDTRLTINLNEYVATGSIPEKPTVRDILELALQREKKTESLYRTLLSFTSISPRISETFIFLVNQEKGHVIIIENKLKQV